MSKNIYLTVVIPCYNEEENIKRGVLSEVYKFLSSMDFSWEVIISDDGSTDNSRELVKKEIKDLKNFEILENEHGGKPAALLSGLKKAKGEWVLFTDMDQSTPISELSKLLPFTNNYCAVIGSRGLNRNNFSIYRQLGSIIFLTFRKSLILPEIIDTQCGFKLFKKEKLIPAFSDLEFFKIKQRTTGWKVTSYDVELLHILKKRGCNIKEVEVMWTDTDISQNKGEGFGRYIRESQEMFSQIIRVKINDLKGLYK